jgi:cytoskeleton protein RodZ
MSASEYTSVDHQNGAPLLGQKLRDAREKLGLSVDDVSHAIKVQANAVRQMEAGDFAALGPPVFAKGFLRSYAKHVHLGQLWLDAELATLALDEAPTLLPSRGERERSSTAERGMLAASYLVGTAILVSAIFVVTHFDRFVGTQSEPKVAIEALVSPAETAEQLAATPPGDPTPNAEAFAVVGAPSVLDRFTPNSATPVVAQPSPLVAMPESPSAVAAGLVAIPNLAPDLQALELSATGTVWVEISDNTGRRLEFNNLSNGVRKSYSGKAPFTLKIGNAANANLIAGGKAVDLSTFTNGSVAKLRLIETNGLLVATAIVSAEPESRNSEPQ